MNTTDCKPGEPGRALWRISGELSIANRLWAKRPPAGSAKSLPDTRLVDRLPAATAASGCPVIANLSSKLGSIAGVTRFGAPSYAISKAAQNMAGAQLAQALAARGIVVLALHPGWVQTDMGGEKAPDAPADVVAGMLRLIDVATPAQSGGFFDWRGERLPW